MIQQTLEKVEANGDEIRLTVLLDKQELVKEYASGYQLQSEITRQLVPLLVKEVMDNKKDEILKQVLNEVNWADVVRSEVAQAVIQQAANKPRNY